jgi:hypothetical protein
MVTATVTQLGTAATAHPEQGAVAGPRPHRPPDPARDAKRPRMRGHANASGT